MDKRPAPQGERAGRHQLGSDDPAYTGSRSAPQQGPPLDPIRVFLPGKTEAEYRLRSRIDRIAVMAASAAAHSPHACARAIFWTAADLTHAWWVRAATEQELIDVIHAAAMMLAAARAVERTDVVNG